MLAPLPLEMGMHARLDARSSLAVHRRGTAEKAQDVGVVVIEHGLTQPALEPRLQFLLAKKKRCRWPTRFGTRSSCTSPAFGPDARGAADGPLAAKRPTRAASRSAVAR